MRQLLQNVSSGAMTVDEVPAPQRGHASLLVANCFSLISAGTERAVMDLGRASLVSKARARPDLVRQVVGSVRTEGLGRTYTKVRGRLGDPTALGYSSCGIVLESCDGAPAAPGELVACAGAGLASHAEIVAVPRTLCARVPEGVAPEDAAYTTLVAIALHGVRLAGVGLGSVVAVVGLGLVGQLTIELVRAAGGIPVGIDPDANRTDLTRGVGAAASTTADELESEIARITAGRGADAVIVAAASTGPEPLATATRVARERAVVCLVGDVAINSPRAPLFSKELKLIISRSYGPGRYDPTYEEEGIDYPAGYVRWTEGRNLEEALRLMSIGALRPSRLTTHTFDLDDGPQAYELLSGNEPSLGILLRYPGRLDSGRRTLRPSANGKRVSGLRRARSPVRVGVIGAGSFAKSVLLPAFAREARIAAVANRTGVSARACAERFGAGLATTDPRALIESDELDAIVIATRHDTHASYAHDALAAGKHVFVEKPLAIDEQELLAVEHAMSASDRVLMVGFNRRFAPLARRLRDALGGTGPLIISYRVNAGRLPPGHWTRRRDVGGGRIVGEMCHFIDFAAFVCGSAPVAIEAASAVPSASEPLEDNVTATIRHVDGSLAVIVYAAFGDPSFAKEGIAVQGDAGAAALDDFRRLELHRAGATEEIRGKRDKGHATEVREFIAACRDGRQPWPVQDMIAVTQASFAIRDRVHASEGDL